jgi:hypothetical protein
MRNIALDNSNNLIIQNGQLGLVNNLDEYLQAVRNALATFRGEWFLNANIGVPYFDKIFDKLLERSALRSIFVNQIKTVPGNLSVDNIEFLADTSTRELTVSFTLVSIYGSGEQTIDLSF